MLNTTRPYRTSRARSTARAKASYRSGASASLKRSGDRVEITTRRKSSMSAPNRKVRYTPKSGLDGIRKGCPGTDLRPGIVASEHVPSALRACGVHECLDSLRVLPAPPTTSCVLLQSWLFGEVRGRPSGSVSQSNHPIGYVVIPGRGIADSPHGHKAEVARGVSSTPGAADHFHQVAPPACPTAATSERS